MADEPASASAPCSLHADIRARIFSMICNMRDVIQSVQVIGIIYAAPTDAANDPSFTATATSIRLKWRRDSAKRDAKQVYAPVANLPST